MTRLAGCFAFSSFFCRDVVEMSSSVTPYARRIPSMFWRQSSTNRSGSIGSPFAFTAITKSNLASSELGIDVGEWIRSVSVDQGISTPENARTRIHLQTRSSPSELSVLVSWHKVQMSRSAADFGDRASSFRSRRGRDL